MALHGVPACPVCNRSLRPSKTDWRLWCIECHHHVHPDDATLLPA